MHPDYGLRKAKVMQAYNDQDKDHLVLVMDQKIFLSDVGVKGREWTTSVPTIPSYQWHNGKALCLVCMMSRRHISDILTGGYDPPFNDEEEIED